MVYDIIADYSGNGNGIDDDYTALSNAENAADASGGIIYFRPGTYLINTSITIDANVTLWLAPGAKLKPANTKVITINGDIMAGYHQIFDISLGGSVAGLGMVRKCPDWWGTGYAAFNACLGLGGLIVLAAKEYSIDTQLNVPNITTRISGQYWDNRSSPLTVITFTQAGGQGFYFSHFTNTSQNYGSILENLVINGSSLGSVVRINNQGVIIDNCRINGGDYGVEINYSISSSFRNCRARGTVAGWVSRIALDDAPTDSAVNNNTFISCAGQAPDAWAGTAAIGFKSVDANKFNGNLFLGFDAEQLDYGVQLVASTAKNTFINTWIEYCKTKGINENANCDNLWTNTHLRPYDAGPPADNSTVCTFGNNSLKMDGGSLIPKSDSFTGQLGNIEDISGTYKMRGYDLYARNIAYKTMAMYPSNVTGFDAAANYKLTDEISFAINNTGVGFSSDVIYVDCRGSNNSFGLIECVFTDVRSDTGSGGVTKRLREWKQTNAGFTAFNTVDTDFTGADAHLTVTFTSVSATRFKVTLAGTVDNLRVTGYVKVHAGVNQDTEQLGVALTYNGPTYT